MTHLAHVSVVVRDNDEALAFYIDKLGFVLVEDRPVPEQNKRWVTIAPPNAPPGATTILLARASSPDQLAAVGRQTGDKRATTACSYFSQPMTFSVTMRTDGRGRGVGAANRGARLRDRGCFQGLVRQLVRSI